MENKGKTGKILQSQSEIEQLREQRFAEFLKYADYKMRRMEIKPFAFARVWLSAEITNPFEALRGQFFNGNPATR